MKSSLLLVPLLIVLAAGTTEAQQSKKEAKKAFKNGVALFEKGAYEDASKAFRKANKLSPKWTILYNIGQCEVAAKRYGIAYEVFEEYLAKGGDEVAEDRRKEVVGELDRLTKMIGSIAVDVPKGSEVWIDNRNRGTAPLPGKLLLAVGVVHNVEIRKDGQVIYRQDVKVFRGETVKVSNENEADQPSVAKMDESEGEPADMEDETLDEGRNKKSTQELVGWIAIGTGGAFLVGGGVTGGIALAREKKLADRCPNGTCSKSDKDYAMGRDLMALSSNILLGIGGAAAVAGIVLVVLGKRKKSDEDDDLAGVTIQPMFSSHFSGLSIMRRF